MTTTTLATLWAEYHQLLSNRVVAVNEGLATDALDARFDEVCSEIEALSDAQA